MLDITMPGFFLLSLFSCNDFKFYTSPYPNRQFNLLISIFNDSVISKYNSLIYIIKARGYLSKILYFYLKLLFYYLSR